MKCLIVIALFTMGIRSVEVNFFFCLIFKDVGSTLVKVFLVLVLQMSMYSNCHESGE